MAGGNYHYSKFYGCSGHDWLVWSPPKANSLKTHLTGEGQASSHASSGSCFICLCFPLWGLLLMLEQVACPLFTITIKTTWGCFCGTMCMANRAINCCISRFSGSFAILEQSLRKKATDIVLHMLFQVEETFLWAKGLLGLPEPEWQQEEEGGGKSSSNGTVMGFFLGSSRQRTWFDSAVQCLKEQVGGKAGKRCGEMMPWNVRLTPSASRGWVFCRHQIA